MTAALMSLIWRSCLNRWVLKPFFPVSIETADRKAGQALINRWARQTCVIRWEWAQERWTLKQEGADKPQPSIPHLPACLLRLWLIRGVDDPFPRGRKRAAPFTVRKLSLMLQGKRQKGSEEKCLVFKKEKRNEQDRLKALKASSVLLQWSDLDQIVLLVKNFSLHVSTANIQSITTQRNTEKQNICWCHSACRGATWAGRGD